MHDDLEILKEMGLTLNVDDGTCTKEQLDLAKSLVPSSLTHYVDEMVAVARKRQSAANDGSAENAAVGGETSSAASGSSPRTASGRGGGRGAKSATQASHTLPFAIDARAATSAAAAAAAAGTNTNYH